MADMLAAASTWLNAQRKASMAGLVAYRRGADQITIAATRGRTDYETDDDVDPAWIEAEKADFIVAVADLVFSSGATKPARGDTIEVQTPTGRLTYQLAAPGREPIWRFSDPFANAYRIHTVLIRTE